ncbi:MAG TPA: aspartate kinase [Candidatus Limnocylindria bacterium]|nr:aspartate kinase [Candidatus Limnocylindria bacterium]
MIVMKFGGTSVGSAEQITTVCELVRARQDQQPVVVVSAVGGTTDLLQQAFDAKAQTEREAVLHQILDKHETIIYALWPDKIDNHAPCAYLAEHLASLRSRLSLTDRSRATQDSVLASGEMLASHLVAQYINTQGTPAHQVIASDLIITTSNHGAAEFIEVPTKKRVRSTITPMAEAGIIPVVTGFIGADEHGQVTTLGRGGSDYSAAIIGHCLEAEEIQIWTDVDGMFTTDPRLFKDALLLERLSFREASELAAFGAKILHPKTIKPAVRTGIPVRILNTFRPAAAGTVITEEASGPGGVTAIACKQQTVMINLYASEMLLGQGFLARICTIFAGHNISVDLVSASEASVSLTLDNDDNLEAALAELSTFTTVGVQRDVGIVSLVGSNITQSPATIRLIFSVLEELDIPVRMVSLGASDINVSLIMPAAAVTAAVARLHTQFIPRERSTV